MQCTGKSRGFAFVEFADAAQAEAAKEALNGFQHDGRPLRINDATEKPQAKVAGARF
jgi:RNA recognition motif-containing protein